MLLYDLPRPMPLLPIRIGNGTSLNLMGQSGTGLAPVTLGTAQQRWKWRTIASLAASKPQFKDDFRRKYGHDRTNQEVRSPSMYLPRIRKRAILQSRLRCQRDPVHRGKRLRLRAFRLPGSIRRCVKVWTNCRDDWKVKPKSESHTGGVRDGLSR